jgi:hypothetical protein
MSLAGGLLLMALVFLGCWVAFTLVAEYIIRRDRRSGVDAPGSEPAGGDRS